MRLSLLALTLAEERFNDTGLSSKSADGGPDIAAGWHRAIGRRATPMTGERGKKSIKPLTAAVVTGISPRTYVRLLHELVQLRQENRLLKLQIRDLKAAAPAAPAFANASVARKAEKRGLAKLSEIIKKRK